MHLLFIITVNERVKLFNMIPFPNCLSVEIKTYTWTKDSNKLFDYECSNLSHNNIVTTDSLVITRKDNQIIFHDPCKGDLPSGMTPLCCLKKTQDGNPSKSWHFSMRFFLIFQADSSSLLLI